MGSLYSMFSMMLYEYAPEMIPSSIALEKGGFPSTFSGFASLANRFSRFTTGRNAKMCRVTRIHRSSMTMPLAFHTREPMPIRSETFSRSSRGTPALAWSLLTRPVLAEWLGSEP